MRYSKHFISLLRYAIIGVCFMLLQANELKANHIYGMDFYYTHVSSNTYTIRANIYGDCRRGSIFLALSTATPIVYIYNGSSFIDSIPLKIQSPNTGVEITPVCPAQANNTACKNGTLPGIKKFVYSANVTLNTTSANWRFRFMGTLNPFVIPIEEAGRSLSINNIVSGSVIQLEATLNNLQGPNSSPTFTTVPTPFFCVNKSAGYNLGAVDPNTDSLTYALVPGMVNGGTVSYRTGYSSTTPISSATNTFNSSTSTGQINFTPNMTQESLVVQKVSEYKNGILVGTSMREMTFVVITCTNNAPGGKITNNNMGAVDNSGTNIKVCKSTGTLTFNINAADADSDTINASVSGLPAGASLTVTNNITKAPTGAFSWNLNGVPTGLYTFYINYMDNGCPIAAKQTTAYTIQVLPLPAANITSSNTLCYGQPSGTITLTGKGATSPYTYALASGSYTTTNTFTGLSSGIHIVHIKDSNGCVKDTTANVGEATPLKFSSIIPSPTTCYKTATGSVSLTGAGGTSPYTYAVNSGSFSSSNSFSSLAGGTHTVRLKDNNGCTLDSSVTISEAPELNFANIQNTPALCFNKATGAVTVTGTGGSSPYTYAVNSGSFSTTNTFTALNAAQHLFSIKDNNNCRKDSLVTVSQPTKIIPAAAIKRATCRPLNNGAVTMSATGGISPYTFAVGTGGYSSQQTFTSLAPGTYTMHVKDNNNCIVDTNINITDSLQITAGSSATDAACKDSSSGTITVTGSNGVSPYTYAIGAGSYGTSPTFTGLAANTYNIRVRDNQGCTTSISVVVNEPAQLHPVLTITEPSCKGNSNGVITVAGTGGTPGYQYALNGGIFSAIGTMSNLATGKYVLNVMDNQGCRADTSVTLSEPESIGFSLSVQNPACNGEASGRVQVNGFGGRQPYTYAYGQQPFGSSPNLTGMRAGTHTIIMRDRNNCLKDTTITLTQPTKVIITGVATISPTCEGFADGSITVNGTGGNPPYSYAANNGNYGTNNTLANLPAGRHIITISDASNCLADTTITLIGLPHIMYEDIVADAVKCFGGTDGVISIQASGGTQPFTYKMGNSNAVAMPLFTGLKEGRYTFTIIDSAGCTKDSAATITSPAKILTGATATANDCKGHDNSGRVEVRVEGGTSPYTYAWANLPSETGAAIEGVKNGTYQVLVTDANDCKDSATAIVVYDNCCNLFIPDAFTPNRDGLNDQARILVKGDFKLEIFAIYNRFGERVFYTNDLSKGWDGMYKATIADLGTYNYYVKGICGNSGNEEVMYKGTILLVR